MYSKGEQKNTVKEMVYRSIPCFEGSLVEWEAKELGGNLENVRSISHQWEEHIPALSEKCCAGVDRARVPVNVTLYDVTDYMSDTDN